MTIREHALDVHGQSVFFKEHVWTCPHHETQELGFQAAAFFESGKRVSLPVSKVAQMLDVLFYDRKVKINNWPTSLDAALHLTLQAALGLHKGPVPRAMQPIPDEPGDEPPTSGDKLRAIIIAAETYMCPPEYEEAIGIQDQDEGDERLRTDFETNPDSKIFETLMTFIVEDDLCGGTEWAGVIQPYRRVEGGGLEWDKPQLIISDNTKAPAATIEHTVKTNAQLRATMPYFNIEIA